MKISAFAIGLVAVSCSVLFSSSPLLAETSSPNAPGAAKTEVAMIVGGPATSAMQAQTPIELVKRKKAPAAVQDPCTAKCNTDYNRCYSEGNRIGTPEVFGGQPCDEQKVMCLRACQQ